MRALQFVAWVVLILVVVVPLVRRRLAASRPRRAPLDELVKDPICQTYVVRSRAVTAPGGAGPLFCSTECARRWVRETR